MGLKDFSIRYIFEKEKNKTFDYVKEIIETAELVIIRLQGNIDRYTIPAFDGEDIKEEDIFFDKHIIMDFKEVTNVDTATIASLINFLDILKNNERKLAIINASSLFNSYLELTHLSSVFALYNDENEALKAISETK
jgi:anti-anti-sigma factor